MAKDWGLEWRLVPPKGRESCRWQSIEAAWVAVTLGHQGDITKIVVTASDGRYEVVEGYEEGLNVARRWRAAWTVRPASDPRISAISDPRLNSASDPRLNASHVPASPARRSATSGGPAEPRPQRPSNRHPVVSVGSFGPSGASADRPTLPGDPGPFGRSLTLSEEPEESGERRPLRASLPQRLRPSTSSLSPPMTLPPLSPATLAPPAQLPELPRPGSRLPQPSRPPRPEGLAPGPLRSRPPQLGPLSPLSPSAADTVGAGDEEPGQLSVLREFGGRGAPQGRRPLVRSLPGAAREPQALGREAQRPDGASAETRSPDPADDGEAESLFPPRAPRR